MTNDTTCDERDKVDRAIRNISQTMPDVLVKVATQSICWFCGEVGHEMEDCPDLEDED